MMNWNRMATIAWYKWWSYHIFYNWGRLIDSAKLDQFLLKNQKLTKPTARRLVCLVNFRYKFDSLPRSRAFVRILAGEINGLITKACVRFESWLMMDELWRISNQIHPNQVGGVKEDMQLNKKSDESTFIVKAIIIGDSSTFLTPSLFSLVNKLIRLSFSDVGKSSILQRFMKDSFM